MLKVSDTPEEASVITILGGMVAVTVSAVGILVVLSVLDTLLGSSVIAGCGVLAVLKVSESGYWMLGEVEK